MNYSRASTITKLLVTTTVLPIMSADRRLDVIASIVMAILGLTGVTVNLYFFIATITRRKYDTSYFKFCRTRAVANIVMAIIFIIWASPITFLGHLFLPENYNGMAGQLAGWGAYIIGPFIQLCIAVNRLFASYFPARFRTWHDKKLTYAVIALSIFIGAGYYTYGISDGCTFHFNVTLLSWLPEDDVCAWNRAYFIFYSVAMLFVASSILNMASFFKLFKFVKAHSGNQLERSRNKKNWSLLIQNIIQDSFFLVDLVAVTFAIKWYDGIWYQWLMNTVLWQLHINADGIVMILSDRRLVKLSPSSSKAASETRVTVRTARDLQTVKQFPGNRAEVGDGECLSLYMNISDSIGDDYQAEEEDPFVNDPRYCRLSQDSWVAAIIFFPALLGFVVNCWNCHKLVRTRQFRGSFAILWISRCVANSILLLIFMFYTSPSILCNRQIPTKPIGYFIANSTGTYYLTILFVQIFLAVHRFSASLHVGLYKFVSGTKCTLAQLFVAWCIGVLSTAQWVVEECEFWFDVPSWSWENDCADWIIEISTPVPVKITICTVILLNVGTFCRLYVLQKRKRNGTLDMRLRNNSRLLWQGTIHDSFFFIDIINQQYTSELYDSKWWNLLCFSISWQWSHILDGVAILVLNEDLRRPIVQLFNKNKVSHPRAFTITKVEDLRMRHT